MSARGGSDRLAFGLVLALLTLAGCSAKIPTDRYGVRRLRIEGVKKVDGRALSKAIVTHARKRALGIVWPWAEWPVLDEASFDRDVARIERWYRARGFYEAKVRSTRFNPQEASRSDRVHEATCPGAPKEGCPVSITVLVDEGAPVLVSEIEIRGIDKLPARVRKRLWKRVVLRKGWRFDEGEYDRTKRALRMTLADASFAKAKVRGEVWVDIAQHAAKVRLEVQPGPPCTFGEIRVQGHEGVPAEPILSASYLEAGTPFSAKAVREAQRAIYELGVFSSVDVAPQLPDEDDPSTVIPVVIRVVTGRLFRYGLGGGFQLGTIDFQGTRNDTVQWDLHLLGFVESRSFFGGFRRLRIENRPRLIFPAVFPSIVSPRLGNEARIDFRQPGFVEPRTVLRFGTRWDYGPDPNVIDRDELFFRHAFDAQLGPERSFFGQRLTLSVKLHANLYSPEDDPDAPSPYHTLFFEELAELDLRNNPQRPSRGWFFGFRFSQGGFVLPSSWDYLRVEPEVRAYVPLWGEMVLAGRFAVGSMWIRDADAKLDAIDQRLGPRARRFRGGGPSSNRGYLPNRVGGSVNGGTREWQSSLELRAPLSELFGLVFFLDAGDVNDSEDEELRFNYLHLSSGLGLRIQTPVGPARADLGLQVPGAQVINAEEEDATSSFLGIRSLTFPGAFYITVGEAF